MSTAPSRLLLLFMGICLISPLLGQESDPRALEIFDKALSRQKFNNRALEDYQYYQTLTTTQYDGEKVIGKGMWRSRFRPGDPDPIEYLEENKEGKLTFLRDEPKKPKATAPEAESSAASKKHSATPAPEEDQALDTNKLKSVADAVEKYSLRDRYIWTQLPDEAAAGENAFVIAYEPRADQSANSREERLFGLLAGKIWVSQKDFTVLKSEGSLKAPYRLLWIIARLTKLDFTYEAEASPSSRLLRRSRATAETIVVVPFNTIRQKHSLVVDKYEERSPRKP